MQYDYSTRGERKGWRKKAKKLTEAKILKCFEWNLNINVNVVTESNLHFVKEAPSDYTGKKG